MIDIIEAKIKEAYYDLICFDYDLYQGKEDEKIVIEERDGGIRKFQYEDTIYTSIPSKIAIEDNIKQLIYTSYAMDKDIDNKDDMIDKIEEEFKTVIGLENKDISELEFSFVIKSKPKEESKPKPSEKETSKKKKEESDKSGCEDGSCKDTSSPMKEPSGKEISMSKKETSETREEIKKDIKDIKDIKDKKELTKRRKEGQLFKNKISLKEVGKPVPQSKYNTDIDYRKLSLEAQRIKRILKGKDGIDKKVSPSKRISTKDVLLEKEKVYIGKGQYNGKKIELNIIVDCSGSMSGRHIKSTYEILEIFNQLAKEILVEGYVIFSHGDGYTTYDFPLSQDKLFPRAFSFAEGFENSMKNNLDILKGKKILCLTDGKITDKPIDKGRNKKYGIKTIGLYLSDKDTNEDKILLKWFDVGISRKTTTGLVDFLITRGLK